MGSGAGAEEDEGAVGSVIVLVRGGWSGSRWTAEVVDAVGQLDFGMGVELG